MKIEIHQGDKLDNNALCYLFGCGPQGGMRRSLKTNTLVIISNHIKSIYDDRWDGDVLYYTGMGAKGDQSLTFAQNKTLAESNHNGVIVHLFEVFYAKEYTYIGKVKLCADPYAEQQKDEQGLMRQVFIFPLQLCSGVRQISAKDWQSVEQRRVKLAKKLSDAQLKERASHSRILPTLVRQTINQYERNIWVAEYAKRCADGVCQLCRCPAPFTNRRGEPYLETHHIIWLAQGGEDTINNTVALCPNCHKKMHIVADPHDVIALQQYCQNMSR